MELILWRHADAEDPGPGGDAARRLTKRGRKQAERMADWLRHHLGPEWRIVVSPAKRALETVKPLDRPFEVCESVGTDATVASVLEEAGWPDGERPVMVVGHQPTLGEVAAQLMGTTEQTHIRKCAVWWFDSRDHGAGRETVLRVVIDPELLEASE
jgi:phosphohistidine phosphatase